MASYMQESQVQDQEQTNSFIVTIGSFSSCYQEFIHYSFKMIQPLEIGLLFQFNELYRFVQLLACKYYNRHHIEFKILNNPRKLYLTTTNQLSHTVHPMQPTPKPQPQTTQQITNAQVINYIRRKCNLTLEEIQRRLLEGQFFPEMPQEGSESETRIMEDLLRDNEFYEKAEIKLVRDETMKFVRNVVDEWSMQIAKRQMRISQDQITNYMSKLLPFGSYVLDLKSNTSDIDLICVCPNFIKRDTHFFQGLYCRFQKDQQVKQLSKVTNAKVPIITFVYRDTDIDISFCQLNQETVPRDIQRVITNDLVESITDEKSQTSLLGRKNNLMILELTGKQIQNFKETLRVVKVWAKNRGISSNGMGYLGGISWAILVAKICQIFPHHRPMQLLREFFLIFSMWSWKTMPLTIMKCNHKQTAKNLMCVITPGSVYNSTQRVNEITFKVLEEEIKRANELMLVKRSLGEVCKKVDFFNSYPLFIEIDICGKSGSRQEEKDYKQFQGSVESRILRLLVMIIDSHKRHIEQETLKIVPFPTLYKKKDLTYEFCNSIFLGIRVNPDSEIDLGVPITKWSHGIYMSRGPKGDVLNVRIFEGRKEDFADVEIDAPKKKKEEKMDPRLAMRMQRMAV